MALDIETMRELAHIAKKWSLRLSEGLNRYAAMKSAVEDAVTISEEIKAAQYAIIDAETSMFMERILLEMPDYDSAAESLAAKREGMEE